jgi:hypothetical protein
MDEVEVRVKVLADRLQGGDHNDCEAGKGRPAESSFPLGDKFPVIIFFKPSTLKA